MEAVILLEAFWGVEKWRRIPELNFCRELVTAFMNHLDRESAVA
jgi:hypothetical protein